MGGKGRSWGLAGHVVAPGGQPYGQNVLMLVKESDPRWRQGNSEINWHNEPPAILTLVDSGLSRSCKKWQPMAWNNSNVTKARNGACLTFGYCYGWDTKVQKQKITSLEEN